MDNNNNTHFENEQHNNDQNDNINVQHDSDFTETSKALARVATDGVNLTDNNPESHSMKEMVNSFSMAIDSVRKHLDDESAQEVEDQLSIIDEIKSNTISTMRESGNLPKEVETITRGLIIYGVNSDNLTLDEARNVYDYANNTTEEIVSKKADRIYDAIVSSAERQKFSRTYDVRAEYDNSNQANSMDIQDRYSAWQQGDLDTSHGFNIDNAYQKLVGEGYEPSSALRRHLEEERLEDLLKEGLVDDDSVYQYGPFTRSDIEQAEKSLELTWDGVVNWRFSALPKKIGKKRTEAMKAIGRHQSPEVGRPGANLANIIKNTVSNSTSNIEQDLVRDYVAGEILQSRRLQAREILMASASLCLDLVELEAPDKDNIEQTLEYNEARTAASFISYYSGQILNISSQEMRKRFGSVRPIKKEFFEEVLQTSYQMNRDRSKYLDEFFNQYLTKLDEHTHDIVERLSALTSGESPLFSEDLD